MMPGTYILFSNVLFICEYVFLILWFRDAEDAVKARDGYDYDGYRLRVEFPRGAGPGSSYRSRGTNERNTGGRDNRGNR